MVSVVTNSVCWNRFELVSLGQRSAAASLSSYQASVSLIRVRYGISEGVVVGRVVTKAAKVKP